MHFCQDELIAIEMAIASVPFAGLALAKAKGYLARRRTLCQGRPACDGHAHEEPAPEQGEVPVKAE